MAYYSRCNRTNCRYRSRRGRGCWVQKVSARSVEIVIKPALMALYRASNQSSDQSTASSNQSTPGQTSAPENSPNSHSSLLKNSSLATVTCPNGKRWLFVQNSKGNLQAVEYSSSASKWNTSTTYLEFPNAAPATPMTASCVNISDNLNNNGSLQLGQYVSHLHTLLPSSIRVSRKIRLTDPISLARLLLFISTNQALYSKAYSTEINGKI